MNSINRPENYRKTERDTEDKKECKLIRREELTIWKDFIAIAIYYKIFKEKNLEDNYLNYL